VAGTDPFQLVGRTIAGGKYRIDRLIGEGGFGAVYAAQNTGLNRKDVTTDIVEAFAAEMGARPVKAAAKPSRKPAKKVAKKATRKKR